MFGRLVVCSWPLPRHMNIHPPPKQYCATRLANSALALQYNKPTAWKSPSFASQNCNSPAAGSVTVTLQDVGGNGLRDDQYPFNYLGGSFDCNKHIGKCAWAELQLSNGSWVNATISLGEEKVTKESNHVSVTLSTPASAGVVVASRYGWGAVPMLSIYDKDTDLPVLPWRENCTAH